jgi:ABC-2 type transport system ATP-binding protein
MTSAISVSGLVKTFGSTRALDDLNLDLGPLGRLL